MARQLLNTLFVQSTGAYAKLDGDTIRVDVNGEKLFQAPLLHFESLIMFEGSSMTPPLMGRCAEEGRDIVFLDFAGRFRFRVVGPVSGNVLLRKAQYDAQADGKRTIEIVRPMLAGKIKNSRQTLLRAARDTSGEDQKAVLTTQAGYIATHLEKLEEMETLDGLRGIEGQVASCYYQAFGAMITRDKADFAFSTRSRRPPRDRVNALLSFVYSLLTADCVAAAEGVGLDPQFGYLHCLRPGRPALALDLMEEFRSYIADRLVLTLINRRQLQPNHFETRPGESVMLTTEGRKILLTAYKERKMEEVSHPLLQSKTPVGLLPHLQARLLARHLRGDMPTYIPFLAR